MSSSRYSQQFLYSFQHGLTSIHGVINLTTQAQAELEDQDITYTAVSYGAAGNSITITLTAGGTAGQEVVTVVGSAIDVEIEDGVSTIDDIVAAIEGSTEASDLVTVVGSGTETVSALVTTPLEGGVDGVVSSSIPGASSVVQTGVGEITVTLSDLYNAFVFGKAMVVKAVAQDLIPQVKSQSVASSKTVVINLLAGATPTDPDAECQLYVMLWVRNTNVSN